MHRVSRAGNDILRGFDGSNLKFPHSRIKTLLCTIIIPVVSLLTGGIFDDLVERLDMVEDAWAAIADSGKYGKVKFVRDLPDEFFPIPASKDDEEKEEAVTGIGEGALVNDDERAEPQICEKVAARPAAKVAEMMAMLDDAGVGHIQTNP